MIIDTLHFSYTVTELARSVVWYEQVLGFEVVHRQRQENAYTQQLVGIDGAVLEIAQLRIPSAPIGFSTHLLELVQYVRPLGRPRREIATNDVGAAHLALLVDDIHARYERMREQGVRFRNPPAEITAGANAGGYAVYFHDLDGFTLELLQPRPERLREIESLQRRRGSGTTGCDGSSNESN